LDDEIVAIVDYSLHPINNFRNWLIPPQSVQLFEIAEYHRVKRGDRTYDVFYDQYCTQVLLNSITVDSLNCESMSKRYILSRKHSKASTIWNPLRQLTVMISLPILVTMSFYVKKERLYIYWCETLQCHC
jgi:hypothetical protein